MFSANLNSWWRHNPNPWVRKNGRYIQTKTADTTFEVAGLKAESSQELDLEVSTLANESGKSHGPTKDSPTVSQFSDSQSSYSPSSDASSSLYTDTTSSQFSDPAQIPTCLPSTDRAKYEVYARQYYGDLETRPSFVINRPRETERVVIIPTVTRSIPKYPKKTNIVLRKWDESSYYWTLDLNADRHIVKAFTGGTKGADGGGAHYKRWVGPHKDDDHAYKGPIAFADRKLNRDSTDSIEREEAAFKPVRSQKKAEGTLKRPYQTTPPEPAKRKKEASVHLSSSTHGSCPSTTEVSHVKTPGPPNPTPHRDPTSYGERGEPRPSTTKVLQVKIPGPPNPGPHRDPASYGERGESRPSTTKVSQVKTSGPPFSSAHQDPVSHREKGKKSPSTIPNSQMKPPSPSREAPATPLNKASMPILAYKQERTTLKFYLKGCRAFHAEKLSSCPTTSEFFACITQTFNIALGDIAEVTVVFTWMDEMAEDREMRMRSGKEADMRILIEEVDNAPFWGPDTGRCILNVYVRQAQMPVSR